MDAHSSRTSITYILPTTAWTTLLPFIAHDAPPGSLIEVHTEAMHTMVKQMLHDSGGADIRVLPRIAAFSNYAVGLVNETRYAV